MKDKKGNLKTVRQNSKKKSAGKSAKPAAKKTSAPKKTTSTNSAKQIEKKDLKKSGSKNHIGEVHRGKTKYIDKETKPERNYVVVVDNGNSVSVAKLKSIKVFDINGKNADKALVEINAKRYGLEKRTGVDFQRFSKNRMSGKDLKLKDKDVFPEQSKRFKLGSHDLARAIRHTKKTKK